MRSLPSLDRCADAPTGADHRSISAWKSWLVLAFRDRPARFAHSVGVLAHTSGHDLAWLGDERLERLRLACLLHDVGRALDPGDHAPHGFVGADFLDRCGLHDVAPLVAHHSGARFEALARDMSHLDRWLTPDRDVLGLLTYFDRTTSHTGAHVSAGRRRTELLARYPAGSVRVVSFDLAAGDAERGRRLLDRRAALTGGSTGQG